MKRSVSPEQRAKMAAGAVEANAVRKYLKRGPSRKSAGRQQDRLAAAEHRLAAFVEAGDILGELRTVQLIADLKATLKDMADVGQDEATLDGFIKHAPSYAKRHNINRTTWRKFGVPSEVLDRAGL